MMATTGSMPASVIIPAWNGRDYLPACLEALLAQDYPDLEIIVVDNASTDGSADLVAETFSEIHLIRNKRNLGFAGGCNAGLKAARDDLLILLNQDTQVHPGWLQALSYALEGSKIGVAGCKILYPDGETMQHAGGWLEWPLGIAHHYGQGEPDAGEWDAPKPVEFVTGAAMAFRREVLERVGFLDEGFWPGYFEDIDFCFRARRAGYEVLYAPEAKLSHAESTSISEQAHISEFYQRGRLRFLLKHLPPDRFLAEFVPAEEAYQWPAILGYESQALRLAYLKAIADAGAILRHRWQADAGTIDAVLRALRRLHQLAWASDWKKVEESLAGTLPPVGAEDEPPALREFEFESETPLLGPWLARFRRFWYGIAARWAVRFLAQQQEAINRRQETINRRQAASQQHYVQALERRLMELTEEHSLLVREVADLKLESKPGVDDNTV